MQEICLNFREIAVKFELGQFMIHTGVRQCDTNQISAHLSDHDNDSGYVYALTAFWLATNCLASYFLVV